MRQRIKTINQIVCSILGSIGVQILTARSNSHTAPSTQIIPMASHRIEIAIEIIELSCCRISCGRLTPNHLMLPFVFSHPCSLGFEPVDLAAIDQAGLATATLCTATNAHGASPRDKMRMYITTRPRIASMAVILISSDG
jgi:hypothetical protein